MRWMLISVLALTACGDDSQNSTSTDAEMDAPTQADTDVSTDLPTRCAPASPQEFEGNGWKFVLDADGAWTATHGDAMLQGPSLCEGGTPVRVMKGEPSVKAAFGNFKIDLNATTATWETPLAVAASPTDESLLITYEMPDATLATLELNQSGTIRLLHNQAGGEFEIACADDESFFGLGSQVTGMDLRGRTFPLWSQEQGNGKKDGGGLFPFNNSLEAAYAPMGILHSSAGWSGIITNDSYSEIDTCIDGYVRVRSYKEAPGLQLLTGAPKERMKRVSEIVGKVGTVPDWVFSLWLDAVGGPWRLNGVATRLRDAGVPASAIWTEDWIGGTSTATGYRLSYAWEWDQTFYPDLPAQVEGLHDQGFAFLTYFNPFVPKPTRMFMEGAENHYLIFNDDQSPTIFLDPAFRDASLVDLTHADSLAWLKNYQLKAVNEIGADGWMADFAEWLPVDTNLSASIDPWLYHNLYTVAWQRANREALEEARPDGNWAFFVRSGWASTKGGTAGVAPLFWGGDQNTDWQYDDGFPTIVPIGAHVGLCGVAIYGSDIAGYNSIGGLPTTTKELWFRWLATAAFHPLMRTHHGGMECENWHFDRDAESTAHMKRYASIHAMLLPYFKGLLDDANNDGLPMTRHPWLVEPSRPELWRGDQYEFFLGDDLLVAPVLTQGAIARTTRIPESGWWPLFGSAPATGQTEGSVVTVDTVAAVTEIPVFVRPGTALVLLMSAPDSFYGGSGVTTLTDVADSYRIALYPDGNGSAASDGAVVISASGLDGWNTAGAMLNGVPLQACNPGRQSCIDEDLVKIACDGTCELVAGSSISITTTHETQFLIGIAGSAWGELSKATPYTPSVETGNWCDDAPN